MPLIIPNRTDLPYYDMQITLDGATYTLTFRWNARESNWYMDVAAEDGTMLRSSLKVVVDFPIGNRVTDPRWPLGVFAAHDTAGAQVNPGLNDLGDRVLLTYFTAADLAAGGFAG